MRLVLDALAETSSARAGAVFVDVVDAAAVATVGASPPQWGHLRG